MTAMLTAMNGWRAVCNYKATILKIVTKDEGVRQRDKTETPRNGVARSCVEEIRDEEDEARWPLLRVGKVTDRICVTVRCMNLDVKQKDFSVVRIQHT
ncbi:hypothetical protein TSAR_015472 [Trichomalopsis sarcophagae]|uniref:Uncharacterized protein n=1 Tax=Trichomalopsis sarcophagae TaxID=543379 RepID=A0A232FA35_9HYME|nr:hypothetical protein TSAR_015472 [Trichomalopsis sarcophagae]